MDLSLRDFYGYLKNIMISYMPKVRKSRKTRRNRSTLRLTNVLSKISRGRKYSNVLKDMMIQKKKLIALTRRIR